MSRPFHLAVPAGDLTDSVHFYEKILECKLGNREEGKWVDVDFWGNELTLHKTNMKLPSERHDVDMGSVPVPHFGVVLSIEEFEEFLSKIDGKDIDFIIKPTIRFKGEIGEQRTMFFRDPSGNAIEVKAFKDIKNLFRS